MATFSADFATERATYTVGGSRNKDDAISKKQTFGPSSIERLPCRHGDHRGSVYGKIARTL
jgi:hypothetical protein